MTPALEHVYAVFALKALGCEPSLTANLPSDETLKFKVRLRDTVRFVIYRWSHQPTISVGLPLVAGIPLEQMHNLCIERLKEEYQRRGLPWPDEQAGGNN